MEKNKPPLGVKPHWLVYQERIEDLNKSIERNAKYIRENHLTGEERKTYFRYIAQWAKEIEALARLETEIDAMEVKQG